MHHARTGQGQYVEVPMFETMVAFTMTEHMGGNGFSPSIGPAGYARLLKGGRKPTPTRDGYLALLPYTEKHWEAFFTALGRKDLFQKYDLSNRHERNKRIHELYADLRSVTVNFLSSELMQLCRNLDIPVTQIYSIDNIHEHEHVQSVGLFEENDHPTEGRVVSIRPTTLFSKTPSKLEKPAPNIGEQTEEILFELGFDQDFIKKASSKQKHD
ncbi:MAG: L-carnitine dehydratase/bile acid-inducible protein F [uncultured bacterium]|nr:MAG: L-carnitine dehydratase/bile acid-inducible protein F [uncultured bacterium]